MCCESLFTLSNKQTNTQTHKQSNKQTTSCLVGKGLKKVHVMPNKCLLKLYKYMQESYMNLKMQMLLTMPCLYLLDKNCLILYLNHI